jgi:hypothetical protein
MPPSAVDDLPNASILAQKRIGATLIDGILRESAAVRTTRGLNLPIKAAILDLETKRKS